MATFYLSLNLETECIQSECSFVEDTGQGPTNAKSSWTGYKFKSQAGCRTLHSVIPDKVVENSSIIANMMLDITENNDNFKVDEELKDQFELKPLSEFEKLMELEREAVAEAVSELLAEVFQQTWSI